MESLKEIFSYIISPVIITSGTPKNFNASFRDAEKRLKQINFREAQVSEKEGIQVGQINVQSHSTQLKKKSEPLELKYIHKILTNTATDQLVNILVLNLAKELHIDGSSLLHKMSSIIFIEENLFEKEYNPDTLSKSKMQEKIEGIFAKQKYHRAGILELLLQFVRKLADRAQKTLKSKLEDKRTLEVLQEKLEDGNGATISITVVVKLKCPEEFNAQEKKTSLTVKPIIAQFDEERGTNNIASLQISKSSLHLNYYPDQLNKDEPKDLNVDVAVKLQITPKKK